MNQALKSLFLVITIGVLAGAVADISEMPTTVSRGIREGEASALLGEKPENRHATSILAATRTTTHFINSDWHRFDLVIFPPPYEGNI
jgi:hypothetical protein